MPNSYLEQNAKISKLKEIELNAFDTKTISLRSQVFQQAQKAHKEESEMLQIAYGFSDFLREKPILISEEDAFAGHAQYCNFSESIPLVMGSPFGALQLPSASFDYEREIDQFIRDARSAGDDVDHTHLLSEFLDGIHMRLYNRWVCGHVIAGYQRVLDNGIGWFIQAAKEKMEATSGPDDYSRTSHIVCEAARDYILRYAAQAKTTASQLTQSPSQKNLMRISQACEWISENPPRDFFEAVQLFWLTHEALIYENFPVSMSLGRIDKYLTPYYQADVAAGRINFVEAYDLIVALWIKFSALRQGYQNVTIGGIDDSGQYLASDVSVMCIRASRQLKMDQPLISVRWHESMPASFRHEVQLLIETGIGFPALINDSVAIEAKMKMGISEADARDYGIVGCVEMSIPGREYSHTEGLRYNWAKVMELLLNDGVCSITGKTIKLKNSRQLKDMKSFDEFYLWYKEEFEHLLHIGIKATNLLDQYYAQHWPNPLLSATMVDCLQNEKDITGGGTRYNNSTVNGCGMANVANALFAIKKIVFDEKKFTLDEVASALKADYQGFEQLQKELEGCSKFGNDDDDVDCIMEELTRLFSDQVQDYENPRGGSFQSGLYTVDDHAKLGKMTGATPDGRNKGISLSNALSAAQGTEIKGPTALINSVLKVDHSRLGNGMVLDLKFHPDFFQTTQHQIAFDDMIKTYFQQGGLEIQFNVLNREELIDAQNHPEKHGDLIVRVSGFSAYFVTLDKVLQDEIMKRTEFA